MTTAYLNRIVTCVPLHDVHDAFIGFGRSLLGERKARLFDRMASRSQIKHRFSVLSMEDDPSGEAINARHFYTLGNFPGTKERMQVFEKHARELAPKTVESLELGADKERITHLIVTSCTGMYAPGIDLDLVERCGLKPSVERSMVGFMGCSASINALKLAQHIVRSVPESHVLLVNLELCSLHLQETDDIEQMLSFLVFGDGCAASLVSAKPQGFAIDRFYAALVPDTRSLITWRIGNGGFDMFLSGKVPSAIAKGLEQAAGAILDGAAPDAFDLWAVHPGGRTVLDAVENGLRLKEHALGASRDVLERFGNMSSATVMFVLQSLLNSSRTGQRGCAMSFGPGLCAETMHFRKV